MEWTVKRVANLGDADYIENGGFLVLAGEDGEAQAEVIEEPTDGCRRCDDEPSGPEGAAEMCEEEIKRYREIFARYPDDDPAALDREIAEIRAKWAPEIAADVERVRARYEWWGHVATHERWEVYQFDLDRYESREALGAAWFGDQHSLEGIARTCDRSVEELIADFLSEDPINRADAYRDVCAVWGAHSFDPRPLRLTRADVVARYEGMEVPR